MRAVLIIPVLAMLTTLAAIADPVTVREAMRELDVRGATQLEGVILSGTPVIKGAMREQGFEATMSECDREDFACRVLIFRTCRQLLSTSWGEAIERANKYNTAKAPKGYLLVDGDKASPSLCVQARYDLGEGDRFDIKESFGWQETIDSFIEFMDDEDRARLSKQIVN